MVESRSLRLASCSLLDAGGVGQPSTMSTQGREPVGHGSVPEDVVGLHFVE